MPSLRAVLGLDASGYHSELGRAKNAVTSFGDHLTSKLAGFASIAGIEETMRRTIEWGESVFDTAIKLNMSTEAVQRLDYALKLSGSSLLEHTKFFEMLSIARDKFSRGAATPEQQHAFKAFGITEAEIKDKNVNLVAIMAKAVESGMDQDSMMAALRALGGRGAAAMAEAFKLGLSDLMKGAPVVSDESITKLKEAGDQIKAVFAEVRASLAPIIGGITEVVTQAFHGIIAASLAVVGSVSKAFELLKERFTDFDKFKKDVAAGGGLFTTIGGAGAREANRYVAETRKAEEERAAAFAKAKRNFHGSGDDEEQSKKEIAHEKKLAAERKKLIEEEQNLRSDTYLKSLKPKERVAELGLALDALNKNKREDESLIGPKTEEAQEAALRNKLEIAKVEKEIAAAKKEGEREDHAGRHQRSVNHLQSIGAYASSPVENAALSVHRRSEQHLKEIKQGIHELAQRGGHGSPVGY